MSAGHPRLVHGNVDVDALEFDAAEHVLKKGMPHRPDAIAPAARRDRDMPVVLTDRPGGAAMQ